MVGIGVLKRARLKRFTATIACDICTLSMQTFHYLEGVSYYIVVSYNT